MINFAESKIKGCFVLQPKILIDERGSFFKFFSEDLYKKHNLNTNWLQINSSFSKYKGTLRGPHFQLSPHEEVKLIKCDKGSVWDLVVDLRQGSPTFKSWHGEILESSNHKMIYIPAGCAHGILSLEDNSSVTYASSGKYHPNHEMSINWQDPSFSIDWPITPRYISDKDKNAPYLF
jgi:dTDP-4-dehydrorhamnose 3,5-epimerase